MANPELTVLVVGGDGAMMDIGFQNLSRVMATNKPIRVVVVDTQVYSNTGGQNSDSSTMLGGYDMNQFGTLLDKRFRLPGRIGSVVGMVDLRAPGEWKQWFGQMFEAFPDFEFEVLPRRPRRGDLQ